MMEAAEAVEAVEVAGVVEIVETVEVLIRLCSPEQAGRKWRLALSSSYGSVRNEPRVALADPD
jgi:hypothetical protein